MNGKTFKQLLGGMLVSATAALLPAKAQAIDIFVDVAGEVLPGVYGNVSIGNRQPVLVYPQPLIVKRSSRYYNPVYLHVPPGHLKNWSKHCARYDACYRPAYFVKSRDYRSFRSSYVPQRYVVRDYRPRDVIVVDQRRDVYRGGDRYYRDDRRSYRDDRKYYRDDRRGGRGWDDRGKGNRGHGNGRWKD